VNMHGQVQAQVEEMFAALKLNEIDAQKKTRVAKYVISLLEGLNKMRLTGEKSVESIIWYQIYDSIKILKRTDLDPGIKVIDLGSGGGLPGIPLKICKPGIEMYLMDSNRKKASFLKELIETLNLENIYVLCGRAEDYGQNYSHREKYDLVLSKAVAEMAVLVEMALPLLKTGGRGLFYKGPKGKNEIIEADKALATCGGELEWEWAYKLQDGEERVLYNIRKCGKAPSKYPRRAGVPSRKPIK